MAFEKTRYAIFFGRITPIEFNDDDLPPMDYPGQRPFFYPTSQNNDISPFPGLEIHDLLQRSTA
jgi:hypothetical protein